MSIVRGYFRASTWNSGACAVFRSGGPPKALAGIVQVPEIRYVHVAAYARLQRMYQREGVTVTLVEYDDQLLPLEARTR